MGELVSGVTEKLQDLLPNQIGANARWTTADVERHIMMADRAVRERLENRYHQQEISLQADVAEYALDSEFIEIVSVEYAADGSTYDYYLSPVTYDDLDKFDIGWRDNGGSRPEHYLVTSAPGLPAAKIRVYRPMTAVDSQTIRVTGFGLGATDTEVNEDVQAKCHVPYTMAILKAAEDPAEAADWFRQYLEGCEEIRRRTRSRYSSTPNRTEVGW